MALEIRLNQHLQEHLHVVDGSPPSNGSCNFGLVIAGSTIQPITLDLFRLRQPDSAFLQSNLIELEEPSPLPLGWQKSLDLKTGEVCYCKGKDRMSRRSGTGPKLDLKLNLSPPPAHNPTAPANLSPNQSGSPASNSPPSSCLSSEVNGTDHHNSSSSPEATSMVLVGCPRCLMYVMLTEDDPKCPKCKSTVLLDFLHDANNVSSSSSRRRGGSRKRN